MDGWSVPTPFTPASEVLPHKLTDFTDDGNQRYTKDSSAARRGEAEKIICLTTMRRRLATTDGFCGGWQD